MGCSNSTMHAAATPRAMPTLQREKTGFVAFDIDIKNNKTKELNKNIDEILSRPMPPKRLQALDSLERAPKLTAEELERKLILADEKRQRTMERKIEFSRRASLRRQSISQEARVDSATVKEKLDAAEEMRTQRLMQIQTRERRRGERVTRIRDEVRRKREGVDEMESELNEVECRESTDEESWQETGKKLKALPPINKSKLDSGADSSGYSSRNISATQDHAKDNLSRINTRDEESSDNEYLKHKAKKPTNPFSIVDNFYDNDLSQESDVDSRASNHVKFMIK